MKIGDIVKIKECHKMPELVGREAKIIGQADPEKASYPFAVELTGDPVEVETPVGTAIMKVFGFREDELEILPPDHDIRPDIKKAFGE